MRTPDDANASAMSSARFTIFETFTPTPGCTSNLVTTGPWLTPTTFASTPKLARVSSRRLARSSAEERSRLPRRRSGALRSASGGRSRNAESSISFSCSILPDCTPFATRSAPTSISSSARPARPRASPVEGPTSDPSAPKASNPAGLAAWPGRTCEPCGPRKPASDARLPAPMSAPTPSESDAPPRRRPATTGSPSHASAGALALAVLAAFAASASLSPFRAP